MINGVAACVTKEYEVRKQASIHPGAAPKADRGDGDDVAVKPTDEPSHPQLRLQTQLGGRAERRRWGAYNGVGVRAAPVRRRSRKLKRVEIHPVWLDTKLGSLQIPSL